MNHNRIGSLSAPRLKDGLVSVALRSDT